VSLLSSGPSRNPDLFYKQSNQCPVLSSRDLPLIELFHFLKGRAALSRQSVPINKETVILEKNQLLFGRFSAMRHTGLSESVIRNRMKKLMEMNQIRKISHKNGKMGYSIYQVIPFSDPSSKKSGKGKKPLCKTPAKSSFSTPCKTTKEKEKNKQHRKNTNTCIKRTPSQPLTENNVCLSNPVIIKNDLLGSLRRFGKDFLDFLLEKAKRFTNNPTNPIGLLIHMLRTGAYLAEYADIQKKRKQTQEQMEALRKLEEQKKEEEKRQQKEMELAFIQSKQLLQEDEEFRNQVKSRVHSTFRFAKTFLRKFLPDGFTVDDVLENNRALSFYSQDLLDILRYQGKISISRSDMNIKDIRVSETGVCSAL